MNKYKNKKTIIDGITFDSKREAGRYAELKLLERAKRIKDLRIQPEYVLQEGFRDKRGYAHKAIKYRADFEYFDIEKNEKVVEDVKGYKTEIYRLKKKLLLFKYRDLNFLEL